jgi:hypothetical protein
LKAGLNTFAYSGSGPIRSADPSGLWELTACEQDWFLSTYGPELAALFDTWHFQRGVESIFQALDSSEMQALSAAASAFGVSAIAIMLQQYGRLAASDFAKVCISQYAVLSQLLRNPQYWANAASSTAAASGGMLTAVQTLSRIGATFGLANVAGTIAVNNARKACGN